MNRRLLALLLAVPLVALAFVAVVLPSPPPPYVEYGEPADRPYVVLRVYGGPTFDVNASVRIEAVLVNPWNRTVTIWWHDGAPTPRLDIVAPNGPTIRVGYANLLLYPGVTRDFAPGENLLYGTWWRPTAMDPYAGIGGVLPDGPAAYTGVGSTFCNFRGDGGTFTLRFDAGEMQAIPTPPEKGAAVRIETETIEAPVAFTGTSGPCLAETAPYLDVRVDGTIVGVNDTVVMDFVVVNPGDTWANVSVDFPPGLAFQIVSSNGTIMFDVSPYGETILEFPYLMRRPLHDRAHVLPPRGEWLYFRIWWNASGAEWWTPDMMESAQFLFELSFRVPGETYTIIASLNWLSLWDGAPYDWDATPAPLRVAPQEAQAAVTFL